MESKLGVDFRVYLIMNEDESGAGGGSVFVAREDLVQALVTLGVTRNAALRALYYTGNYNADLAAAWIFENQDKNLDAPLTETLELGDSSSDDDVVEEFLGIGAACKMVLVVNMELGMGAGKTAGQVAHAAVGLYRLMMEKQQQYGEMLMNWEQMGEVKIVLKGQNASHLTELATKASNLGLPFFTVHDAGKTQVASGSLTVLGIMGNIDVVNTVTGELALL